MADKKQNELPWSFYAVIVSFGVFFFSLATYLTTLFLNHPFQSNLWLLGVGIGLIGLVYSIYMSRVHQKELVIAYQEKQ